MNDYQSQLRFLSMTIANVFKSNPAPYVHCSKINSFLSSLRLVKQIIDSTDGDPPKKTKHTLKNAVQGFVSVLDHIQQLQNQCVQNSCVEFVVNSSLRGVLGEIASMRKEAAKHLEALNLKEAANVMQTSESDLLSENLVDIRRIAQVLDQVFKRKDVQRRADVMKNIAKRRQSLNKWNVDFDDSEHETISVSDLPVSSDLLVSYEDLVFGEQIGVGQSGRVVRGKMKKTGHEVAIKILRTRVLNAVEFEMFRREITMMAVLQHPNLLSLMGYTSESPYCLITEYMVNGSLAHFMKKHGSELNGTERSLIALDIARGMEFLHSRGIIHRDLKSLNVLLDEKKRAKVGDFGLARVKAAGPMTGLVGTSYYMAPEVVVSAPYYDERVDVYSYGIVLWELLTNTEVYAGEDKVTVMTEVIQHNRRPLIPLTTPEALKILIQRCWSQDANDRPSFREIIEMLQLQECQFPGCEYVVITKEIGMTMRSHGRSSSVPSLSIRETVHKRMSAWNRMSVKTESPERALKSLEEAVRAGHLGHFEHSVQIFGDSLRAPNIDWARIVIRFVDIMNKSHGKFKETLVQVLFDFTENPEAFAFLDRSVVPALLNSEDISIVTTTLAKLNSKSDIFFTNHTMNALLAFAQHDNPECRISAMKVLVEYAKKSTTTSSHFILGLLNFTARKLTPKDMNTLFSGISTAIKNLQDSDPQIATRLGSLIQIVPDECVNSFCLCIVELASTPAGTADGMVAILTNAIPLFDKFASIFTDITGKLPVYYGELTVMLFKLGVKHKQAFEQLIELNKKYSECRRVTKNCLPVRKSSLSNSIVRLYDSLLVDDDSCVDLLLLPQFYQAAPYLIEGPNGNIATHLLRLEKVRIDLFEEYACDLMCDRFLETSDTDVQVRVLSIIYSISASCEIMKFQELIPRITSMTESADNQVAQAAFLAVSLLAKRFPKSADANALLKRAAYYVNYGGSHARNASIFLLGLFGSPANAPMITELFVSYLTEKTESNTEFARRLVPLLSRASPPATELVNKLMAIFAHSP